MAIRSKYLYICGVLVAIAMVLAYFKLNSTYTKDLAVLLVFNGKYDQEAENLLASIKKNAPELIPYMTICASDENSKGFAVKHGLPYFEMNSITATGEWDSINFKIMMRRKIEGIVQLLKQKKNVLYIDTDIVLLDNPFKEIKPKFDLNIQNDQRTPPYNRDYLCAGFMHIKSNAKTIELFEKVIARMEQSSYEICDQKALNYLLKQAPDVKVNVLDECKFPNGCRYFDHSDKRCAQSTALIVHNNYLIGMENKRKRFADNGLLFYPPANLG